MYVCKKKCPHMYNKNIEVRNIKALRTIFFSSNNTQLFQFSNRFL